MSSRRSGREAHGGDFVFALGKRERETAVEDVASTQRVDRLHREYGASAQGHPIAPEHVLRALSDGEK